MPRRPTESCSRCGRAMWKPTARQPVCHSCRRLAAAPYGPRPGSKSPYKPDNPYGAEHQRIRKMLLPLAIGTRCPICSEVMTSDQDLSLDHSVPLHVDPASKPDRIVHSRCNSSWRSGNDTPPMTPEQRRQKRRDQARLYSQQRGSTKDRGYGSDHQRRRRYFAVLVERGEVCCGKCGKFIPPGSDWHLAHPNDDKTLPSVPWHRLCNLRFANERRRRVA